MASHGVELLRLTYPCRSDVFADHRHNLTVTNLRVVTNLQTFVVTEQRVPVVTHVELLVHAASVAFVDGNQAIVTRVLVEEVTCKKVKKKNNEI